MLSDRPETQEPTEKGTPFFTLRRGLESANLDHAVGQMSSFFVDSFKQQQLGGCLKVHVTSCNHVKPGL